MSGGFCARRKVCIRKNLLGKILGGLFSVVNKVTIVIFFYLCGKKMELMKQIHLFKKGFVIFLHI